MSRSITGFTNTGPRGVQRAVDCQVLHMCVNLALIVDTAGVTGFPLVSGDRKNSIMRCKRTFISR
jgi:hypothetical protein